ncbi:formyltransferase family protein [uncultured Ruegeria sp.]|jgi:methionyl-tRNA formyltransferase|uniref:formyltransferase family protein n=1 Tax=uncultured Ruegeria sp. TaxID=259304 RepID=UPI00262F9620|nr:formyltransferase family protein [uncultured Ruegeria sp.]
MTNGIDPAKQEDRPTVLFFGRENCDGTQKALQFLNFAGFDVSYVESQGLGQALPDWVRNWRGDYIFCFRSYFILDQGLIDAASIAAINFHPGPPEYPGSGCINFALYEGAETYGVTAHIINAKVDNGTIIKALRFPILKHDGLRSVLARTHLYLFHLLQEVVGGIATGGENYLNHQVATSSAEAWRGEARRMKELSTLQKLPLDIDVTEFHKRLHSMHLPEYPLHISLHGRKFVLLGEADED